MSSLRPFSLLALAAAALAVPASASPAPAATSFKIVGYEYAFTSKVGSFAGKARPDSSGTALWNARVKHDRLGSVPTYVNGGSFALTVRDGSALDAVSGRFSEHGGTITTLDRGAGCTKQRYLVTATLENVSTRTTSDGVGSFEVTLTHFRKRVLGRCVAYKARVAGTVSFSY